MRTNGTPVTSSTVTAASWPTTRRTVLSGCSTLTTAWGSGITTPSKAYPRRVHAIWPRSVRRCCCEGSSRDSRLQSGSTRSAHSLDSRRRGSTWPAGSERRHAPEETMTHAAQFLSEAKQVIDGLNVEAIERMAAILEATRDRGGRLFILGVGGSAANASHAVNDFRKIVGIEAYAPTDNVSELTARTRSEEHTSELQSLRHLVCR